MTLTKPNQDLRRDLQGLASDLKWSAVELMRIAVRLSEAGNEHDAQAVIRICQVMQAGEQEPAWRVDLSGAAENMVKLNKCALEQASLPPQ